MRLVQAMSILLVSAWGAAPAAAQAPAGTTMLVPGVYTTAEISRKCQKYAADRVGTSGHTDTARHSLALACAQKLWSKQVKGAK